jgi:hypothetical protein
MCTGWAVAHYRKNILYLRFRAEETQRAPFPAHRVPGSDMQTVMARNERARSRMKQKRCGKAKRLRSRGRGCGGRLTYAPRPSCIRIRISRSAAVGKSGDEERICVHALHTAEIHAMLLTTFRGPMPLTHSHGSATYHIPVLELDKENREANSQKGAAGKGRACWLVT